MRVTCVTHRIADIAADQALGAYLLESVNLPGGLLPLEPGCCYTVYALLLTNIGPWVFIREDQDDFFPIAHPLPCFQIQDPDVSRHWVVGEAVRCFRSSRRQPFLILTFPEWAGDDNYYERLVDGDGDAEGVFDRYRRWMDEEHAAPRLG